MSFCYKKILGVFTHLRVTTPNIIEPLFTGHCPFLNKNGNLMNNRLELTLSNLKRVVIYACSINRCRAR